MESTNHRDSNSSTKGRKTLILPDIPGINITDDPPEGAFSIRDFAKAYGIHSTSASSQIHKKIDKGEVEFVGRFKRGRNYINFYQCVEGTPTRTIIVEE